jgi:outer membrane protein assembly factor BamB
LLFSLGADGDLRCWRAEDGTPLWWKNLYDSYGVLQRPNVGRETRDFGMTGSPVVIGDWLVVEVGAREGTVIAFNTSTGEEVWRSDLTGPAGHTSGPTPIHVRGVPCVAALTLDRLVVLRLDEGHEGDIVAEFGWRTNYACSIATPAVDGNSVLLTSGYNQRRSSLLAISPAGIRPVWTSRRYAVVSSPVIHGGRAFLVSGVVQCLDLATGDSLWQGGRFGDGSCIMASGDGRLIVFGNRRLALVEARPASGAYTELSRIDGVVPGTCYPHVALSDGLMFCKDRGGNMVCLDARGE